METVRGDTGPSKLWRTIKAIHGKSPPNAENEAITFDDTQVSSPKQIANYFNRQFTTSKLGRHTSSRETRIVYREIKRKSFMSAVTFATDQVIKAISNGSNTKAFGPDKLRIVRLKHLGPSTIEYLTALFNDSVTSCRIPAIWKSYIVIPIPKPGKDSSLGTSYRPISLLCPAAKVMEALILTTVNTHLLPASDQHGFRTGQSTTSALQLTSDVATGFNQRKPPHRTVCVDVDLTAVFDTVNHNALLSILISAPKASVTLFTLDPAQANTRPKIKIADSELPLVRSPKLLGVYLDTFFSFNKHCVQVANRGSKENVLNALAGTNCGQKKETLLMTYKALGRSTASYAAPVWSINASETNIGKIQRAQNEALRIITGSHLLVVSLHQSDPLSDTFFCDIVVNHEIIKRACLSQQRALEEMFHRLISFFTITRGVILICIFPLS